MTAGSGEGESEGAPAEASSTSVSDPPQPTPREGQCIRFFEESSAKKPFAVVVAIAGTQMLIARGTSNGAHPRHRRILPNAVSPGTRAAGQWRPPLDEDTYFHDFDIKPIEVDRVGPEDLGGRCDQELWDAIRTAAQNKSRIFMREYYARQFGKRGR